MSDDSFRRITPSDLLLSTSADRAPGAPASPPAPPGCQRCRGAGFYKEDVAFGHPHFGVLFPCECRKAALAARRRAEMRALSNLDLHAEEIFATFAAYQPSLVVALRRAQEFARRPDGWLVLFGNYGCGKTHLAAAVGNELVARTNVYFGPVPDLLDHLRRAFAPESRIDYDDLFERIRNIEVLILDDLGTEAATPWAREKLFQLINHRYALRLPTVLTSNQRPSEIDGRIFSRISDRVLTGGGPLVLDAGDYRTLSEAERALLRQKPTRAQPGAPRRRGDSAS